MDVGGIDVCHPGVLSLTHGDVWEAALLSGDCGDCLIHRQTDALARPVDGMLWDFDSCDLDELEETSHPSTSTVDVKTADPRPSVSKEKNRL